MKRQYSGDEEGEFTFIGDKRNTVIDYVIGDKETRNKIRTMKIGDKADSNHHPIELWVEGKTHRSRKEGKKQIRINWNREGREWFKEKLKIEREQKNKIDEEWSKIKKHKESIKKSRKRTKQGFKKWRGMVE